MRQGKASRVVSAPADTIHDVLTVRDHMAITLATTVYKYAAQRDADVAYALDYTPTQLYARVAWLLEQPEALAERPTEVARLRRLRSMRTKSSVRRTGFTI